MTGKKTQMARRQNTVGFLFACMCVWLFVCFLVEDWEEEQHRSLLSFLQNKQLLCPAVAVTPCPTFFPLHTSPPAPSLLLSSPPLPSLLFSSPLLPSPLFFSPLSLPLLSSSLPLFLSPLAWFFSLSCDLFPHQLRSEALQHDVGVGIWGAERGGGVGGGHPHALRAPRHSHRDLWWCTIYLFIFLWILRPSLHNNSTKRQRTLSSSAGKLQFRRPQTDFLFSKNMVITMW